MKTRIFILLIAVAFSTKSFSQLGTPLSQFSGNQITFNPGYAGIYEMLTLNLSMRHSWIQLPGSPRIINFNGHVPIQRAQHSLGWIYQREEWGPLAGNFGYGNYAYKLYTRHGILNFGLQGGFVHHSVDWTKFGEDDVEHRDDIWFDPDGTGHSRFTKFDANVGVFFLTPTYYVGLSGKHLTNPKFEKRKVGDVEWYSQMPMQWYLIAGYHYDFDDYWSLRPEVFLRYVHNTPLSANIGLHGYYRNDFSFGINYITGQKAMSFSVRALLTSYMRVGYSYDVYWGPIKPFQRGSHEIMLNYYIRDIWRDKKNLERFLWQ
jgi:type IX secretion system PorP/SprF family membrane protein